MIKGKWENEHKMTLQFGRGAPAAPAATLDSAGALPCFLALGNLKVYFYFLNSFLFNFVAFEFKSRRVLSSQPSQLRAASGGHPIKLEFLLNKNSISLFI